MKIPLFENWAMTLRIYDQRNRKLWHHKQIRDEIVKTAEERFLRKVVPGENVVVGSRDPLETLFLLFAAWSHGNTVVLVSPDLKSIERETVLQHTGATHWFGHREDDSSPSRCREPNCNADPTDCAPAPLQEDDPALVLMTSGTTGVPKGIIHSVRSLSTRLRLNLDYMSTDLLERSLCVLPLFFGHGLIGNCLTPLAAGQTLHLWPHPSIAELSGLGTVLDGDDITFMSSVPSFWKLATRMPPPAKHSLKRVHIGSAPLSSAQAEAVRSWTGAKEVFNMYGMTETANWIGGGEASKSNGMDGYVGKTWGGRYAIEQDNGTVSPHGQGAVLVDSPSLMLGYFNAPDQTADARREGWFRTGDIGHLDENGNLTLLGRSKTEINRGGIKILAEEIDMMLERNPSVDEACAFGIPDPVSGEAIAAAVVLKPGHTLTQGELQKWCRDQVRTDALPSWFYFVEQLPKNDRGKLVRSTVREALFEEEQAR